MKDTTFGDSEAAVTLAKILTQTANANLSASVSSIWCSYSHGANEIMKMPDRGLARSLLILWKDNSIKRARERHYGEVQTFLVNIIVAKFRNRKELQEIKNG